MYVLYMLIFHIHLLCIFYQQSSNLIIFFYVIQFLITLLIIFNYIAYIVYIRQICVNIT